MSRFVFSASVKAAVRRGLDLREQQPKSQRATLSHAQARAQGIVSGLTTARKILNDTMGEEDVKRLLRYHSRHAKNMALDAGKKPVEDKGYVAGLIWGGRGAAGEARQMMRRLEKATGAKTPAPPRDRVFGSKRNKRGSAATTRGGIKVDPATEKALRNKLEALKDSKHKIDLGTLKAVYRRGAGAFSTSHRPGMGRNQWSMGRVNAFIRLLQTGKRKPAYTTDLDLLPSSHPQSTRKSLGAATLLKGSGALDGAVKWYRVPGWLARALRAAQLAKGAGHKYVKRVPTGKFTKTGKPRYRYYYAVHHGAGVVGHEDELKRGAAFKLSHNGQDGHFHVIGVYGDKLRIKHDETGHEAVVEKSALQAMLREHHAEAIGQARERARKTHEAAQKTGSAKQKARAKARAEKIGAIKDKPARHKDPHISKAQAALDKLPAAFKTFSQEKSFENLNALSDIQSDIQSSWGALAANSHRDGGAQLVEFVKAFDLDAPSEDPEAEISKLISEFGHPGTLFRLIPPRMSPESYRAHLRLKYLNIKHPFIFPNQPQPSAIERRVAMATHTLAQTFAQTLAHSGGINGPDELLKKRSISIPYADKFPDMAVSIFIPSATKRHVALNPSILRDVAKHEYSKLREEYKASHKRNIGRVNRVLKKLKASLPPDKVRAALEAGASAGDLIRQAGGKPAGESAARASFRVEDGSTIRVTETYERESNVSFMKTSAVRVTDSSYKKEDPFKIVEFLAVVDAKTLPENVNLVLDDRSGRAECSKKIESGKVIKQTVNLFGSSSASTAWHEFGHAIENANPGILEASHAIRDERGKKSAREQLYGRNDELTYKDEWANPYTGKWYGTNLTVQHGTEILSMGVQEMFADAGAFLKQDEQHFYFTLAALSGRLNKRGS